MLIGGRRQLGSQLGKDFGCIGVAGVLARTPLSRVTEVGRIILSGDHGKQSDIIETGNAMHKLNTIHQATKPITRISQSPILSASHRYKRFQFRPERISQSPILVPQSAIRLAQFRPERISQSPILRRMKLIFAIAFRPERISQSPILFTANMFKSAQFRPERISQSPILRRGCATPSN